MFKIIGLILFMFLSFLKGPVKLLKTIDKKADIIAIDQLSEFYIVSNNVLYKYNTNGDLLYEYSNYLLGNIRSVDVTNPMQILVYYEEYNELIFLDNKLAEIRSPVMLDDLQIGLTSLACTAEDGGFWVYAYQKQQLLHFSNDLKPLHESTPLNTFIEKEFQPEFLLQKNNHIYLNLVSKGVLVFNIYGFYEKTIPYTILDDFQVNSQNLYYNQGDTLILFNQKSLVSDTLLLKDKSIIDIKISNNRIVARTKSGVKLFQKN